MRNKQIHQAIGAMTVIEILTIISSVAFVCCQICFIIILIYSFRVGRKLRRQEEARQRDYDALSRLSGDEYWKAYAEYKQKYNK